MAMHAPNLEPLSLCVCRSRRAEAAARQMPRREAEHSLRTRTATLCNELTASGQSCRRVAEQLHLAPRTLTHWRCRQQEPTCLRPRGRRCKDSSPAQRQAVLAMLEKEGCHIGLPTLRAEFPDMPRCELVELQAAYRRYYRASHRRSTERLTWHEPGYVWAMDHVVPPQPIDGVDRAAFAVRDLASGQQLAWQPVPDQTAAPTAAVLQALFRQHGPPLVLKSDNGSAFRDQNTQDLLAAEGVVWLPSPPRKPWYNGSCEAGNHSMRTRTDHFAERAGGWTSQSLAAARRQANEFTRLGGPRGDTHSRRWAARLPVRAALREQLRAMISSHREQVIAERGDNFQPANKNHQHQVLRQAARRALLELGLLTVASPNCCWNLSPKDCRIR